MPDNILGGTYCQIRRGRRGEVVIPGLKRFTQTPQLLARRSANRFGFGDYIQVFEGLDSMPSQKLPVFRLLKKAGGERTAVASFGQYPKR